MNKVLWLKYTLLRFKTTTYCSDLHNTTLLDPHFISVDTQIIRDKFDFTSTTSTALYGSSPLYHTHTHTQTHIHIHSHPSHIHPLPYSPHPLPTTKMHSRIKKKKNSKSQYSTFPPPFLLVFSLCCLPEVPSFRHVRRKQLHRG